MIALFLRGFGLCTISWILWRLFQQFFSKSDIDNIAGPPAKSFFKGVLPQLFGPDGWTFHQEILENVRLYQYFRNSSSDNPVDDSVVKIQGMLGDKQLYVFDPKALHHIVIKDQYVYEETTAFIEGNRLMLGHGLLGTLGDQHKKQRKMLNPVFSIAHMRDMIPTFYDITRKLEAAFAHRLKDGPKEIEVLSWFTRTALELVGQTGLGYSFDPLTDHDEPHPYAKAVKQLVPDLGKINILARIYLIGRVAKIGTPRLRRFMMNILPWKRLHHLRDVVDLIYSTSVEIYESKKNALAQGDEVLKSHVAQGKDIISILIRANMAASEGDKLSEKEVIGQMSTLTFAAMDTTSAALSRIMWLLAQHQDVQDKLRLEIQESLEGKEQLDYEELVSLPYMDAVCREIMRLYPPISSQTRTTRKDILLPLSGPIKGLDGREMTEIFVRKNTNIIIPIYSCNRNPEIWGQDAYEFKPERWMNPLPESVTSAHIPGVYSNLMTFFGGGRSCIGFKFSQMEMKVVLSVLLNKFKFSLPKDKEIYWVMTAIAAPYVVGEPGSPQLPLIVEHA